jgi:hypothetical protein
MSLCGVKKKTNGKLCTNPGTYDGKCGIHKKKPVPEEKDSKISVTVKDFILPEKHYPKLVNEDVKYENEKVLLNLITTVNQQFGYFTELSPQVIKFMTKILHHMLTLTADVETLADLLQFIKVNMEGKLRDYCLNSVLKYEKENPWCTIGSLRLVVIDYLCGEILELSIKKMKAKKVHLVVVNYYHVCYSMFHDTEIRALFLDFLPNMNNYDDIDKKLVTNIKIIPFTQFSSLLTEYNIFVKPKNHKFIYNYLIHKFMNCQVLILIKTPTMIEYFRFWLDNMIELFYNSDIDFKFITDSFKRDDLDERCCKLIFDLIKENIIPDITNIIMRYILG